MTNNNYFRHIRLVALMVIAVLFAGCGNTRSKFHFESTQEALDFCHKELSKIASIKKADIDKLTRITSSWLELRDSTLYCLMNDTAVGPGTRFADDFFMVSDSFRTEITRLANSEKRTLPDIVKLKMGTAGNRDSMISPSHFKQACAFYSDADKDPLYGDLKTALAEYDKVLSIPASLDTEGQLYDFIRKENKCFRSMLAFLKDVPQEKLEALSSKTSAVLDDIYRNAGGDMESESGRRVMAYLTMRMNRRIIQNAQACCADIVAKKELDEKTASNYRWMLLQPFFSIDNYAMALLTEEQVNDLLEMASRLPIMLAYVDGKDFVNSPVEEKENIQKLLSNYFLKSYLSSIL